MADETWVPLSLSLFESSLWDPDEDTLEIRAEDWSAMVAAAGPALEKLVRNAARKIIWTWILGHCRAGVVRGNAYVVSRRCGLPVTVCADVLGELEGPDANSATPDHGGRRLEAVAGGWIVLNHATYLEAMLPGSTKRQETARERQQRYRESKKSAKNNVAPVLPVTRDSVTACDMSQPVSQPPCDTSQLSHALLDQIRSDQIKSDLSLSDSLSDADQAERSATPPESERAETGGRERERALDALRAGRDLWREGPELRAAAERMAKKVSDWQENWRMSKGKAVKIDVYADVGECVDRVRRWVAEGHPESAALARVEEDLTHWVLRGYQSGKRALPEKPRPVERARPNAEQY